MATNRTQSYPRPSASRKRLLLLAILLIALYVVIPQLKTFHNSLAILRQVRWAWVLAAVAALAVTYAAAAGVYVCLAWKPLPFGRTTLVQVASMFANRILPAGAGAVGINFAFLRRQKHSQVQAAAVVTANNVLGFVGNMLILAVMVLGTSLQARDIRLPHIAVWVYLLVGTGLLALLAAVWSKYGTSFRHSVAGVLATIFSYRHRPAKLLAALLSSTVLTAAYTACLYASLVAVGVHIAVAAVFVVMTVGVAGSTVVPTPGGLGGAEAGLLAGLLIYNVPSVTALAGVLLYRLITYWLALIIGVAAFVFAQRRQYI